MFKTIIQFLKANTLLASISKVVLVTTVSISSVSASAYIIDSISAPEENDETETFISTNVESDESIEVETNQVEEEVQKSASKSTENESGLVYNDDDYDDDEFEDEDRYEDDEDEDEDEHEDEEDEDEHEDEEEHEEDEDREDE